MKTYCELTEAQKSQVSVQWSGVRPDDYLYEEGRGELLLCRRVITSAELATHEELHPLFHYRLYEGANLQGIVSRDCQGWQHSGESLSYRQAQQLVADWPGSVLRWQCYACRTEDHERLARYVGRVSHGLCRECAITERARIERELTEVLV